MGLLLPTRLREAVIGDLEEEYEARAAADPRAAARWYWRMALVSVVDAHAIWRWPVGSWGAVSAATLIPERNV